MIYIPYNLFTSDYISSVSTENLSYPRTNLDDTDGHVPFKFEGYSDENIVFDAGSGNTFSIDAFGIVNHNLTSGATITLEGNATDVWTSPSFQQVITWRSGVIFQYLSSVQTYRFFRIRIQDSGNTEEIKLGYISGGLYNEMPAIQSAYDISDEVQGSSYISASGAAGGSKKYKARVFYIVCNNITWTERGVLRTMNETNGDFQPMIGQFYAADYDEEPAFYFIFEKPFRISQTKNVFAGKFTVREVF